MRGFVPIPIASALGLVVVACTSSSPAPAPAGPPPPVTLLTLNLANGAGDRYRTPDARRQQAAFVAAAHADVVALQEVDLSVVRSGHADTAREVATLECTVADPPFTVDGLRRCAAAGDAGVVLFGRAFQGDDLYDSKNGMPTGIVDDDPSIDPPSADVTPTATFGNALAVYGHVADAYVVALPNDASAAADENDPLFAELAREPVPESARADLAARNQASRRGPAIEPRIVLVARVTRGSRTLSVLVTHLEAGDQAALRARQLTRVLTVAKAERAGAANRDVVVLGDFNQPAADATAAMAAAGLRSAPNADAGVAGFDQIWVDTTAELAAAELVPTAAVSDHPFAVRAVLR